MILQIIKLGHREVKLLAQGHIGMELGFEPSRSDSRIYALSQQNVILFPNAASIVYLQCNFTLKKKSVISSLQITNWQMASLTKLGCGMLFLLTIHLLTQRKHGLGTPCSWWLMSQKAAVLFKNPCVTFLLTSEFPQVLIYRWL